ncbi:MAG: ABC transporter permease [Candidatus Hydrogenedentes bacterium]|nr:ABC transporter permease [Candidatus Hydrogenedentota bacterium]
MFLSFWKVLRRELHIIAHHPFYYLFTFIIPIITFLVLCAIFYHEIPRDLPVVVCNRNGSPFSLEIIREIDASPSLKVVAVTPNFSECVRYVCEGRSYAVIYIPEEVDDYSTAGKGAFIVAYYNNQWMLVSSLLSRALREVTSNVSLKEEVRFRTGKGEPFPLVSIYSTPIVVDAQPLNNPNLNYRFFLLPAILPSIIQGLVMMVSIRSFGSELKHGTIREWMARANGNYWIAIVAKAFPYTLGFTSVTLFMMTLLTHWGNVPFRGNLWFVVVTNLFFILAYQGMGFAFVSITANLRMANSLGGFYTGPAFAFAGITYPTIGMPLPAKILSSALPLTHYLHLYLEQSIRGVPTYISFPKLCILFCFFFVPFLLFAPRWKKFSEDEKYWGRI